MGDRPYVCVHVLSTRDGKLYRTIRSVVAKGVCAARAKPNRRCTPYNFSRLFQHVIKGKEKLTEVEDTQLVFSGHAIKQMFQRRISRDAVKIVISTGEVIADYPDDHPYPSCLMLGFSGDRPIHVVAAHDAETQTVYVITAYEPDVKLWQSDFKSRRPQ